MSERTVTAVGDKIIDDGSVCGHDMTTTNLNSDVVEHPVHYQSYIKGLNIEAIDCMRAAFGDDCVKGFCICNAQKYLYRHQSKGGRTDILKCKWYIDKYLELGGCE